MNLTLLDLVYLYIYYNFDNEPSLDIKRKIASKMIAKLKDGYTDKDIKQSIKTKKKLTELQVTKDNILNPEEMYYHNELKVMPDSQVIVTNEEELVQVINDEFFIEPKASYSMDQLYNYYVTKLGLNKDEVDIKKTMGSLKYIVTTHGIDLTLYMIDSYLIEVLEGRKKLSSNTISLTDMIDLARNTLGRKIGELRSIGNDGIKPRTRRIDFGSRSKI